MTINWRLFNPTPWTLEEQTTDQLRGTIESLEHHFARCKEIQQGISTKESVRHRMAVSLLEERTGEGRCQLCEGPTFEGYCRACDFPTALGHI